MFELGFYQSGTEWKHKLIPIEISTNDSDKVIDLMIYQKYYVLIKKSHVFLGIYDLKIVFRRCLSSYSPQIGLIKQEQSSEKQEKTIKTSN